ncbi:uncharacterized protein LOC130645132 [Hydractinia symbiolongicarpus]|uniref:uncharacterized protein LOC130645132 n=1 Tax=Hydractinia symbiolongicarpus TaxID=13093 RepID=UPI00254B122D|nr:uncharacterized protein LOC130645132 [Hydractinia symbiolongicarpus]
MMLGILRYCVTIYILLRDFHSCQQCDCASSDSDKWNKWGEFSPCNNANLCVTGFITRHREYNNIFCSRCNNCDLYPNSCQTKECGKLKNDCEQTCNSRDGSCSCDKGYNLDAASGKFCHDIDECALNIGGCSQICTNTLGSYDCRCREGYYLDSDGKTCIPYPCQDLVLAKCPANTYIDHLGAVCNNVTVSCPKGSFFNQSCRFQCPSGYGLATINSVANEKFGESLQSVNFNNVELEIKCIFNGSGKWDVHSSVYQTYYCRRFKDPPKNLQISNSSILEHSPIHSNVGLLSAVYPSTVVFSIESSEGVNSFIVNRNFLQNSKVFTIKSLSDTTIDVKIRATDATDPKLNTEALFTIKILNVNDPPKDIEISSYIFTDLTPVGSVIGNLSAIDYDILPPVRSSTMFVWTLKDSLVNQHFTISNGSLLVLTKKFPEGPDSFHKVSIVCTDKDTMPASTVKELFIERKNLNSPPVNIVINIKPVSENTPTGSVIGTVTATDNDNDTIVFENISLNKIFNFGKTDCKGIGNGKMQCDAEIVLMQKLDYETANQYDLALKATDAKGEYDVKRFLLKVVDVNEPPYNIKVRLNKIDEGSEKDTLAGELEVLDVDADSTHNCSILDAHSPFKLRAFNIVLRAGRKLDHANQSVYNVTISCQDNGFIPLSITRSIPIYVTASFSCPKQFYRVAGFKCLCVNRLSGKNCDRNMSLCRKDQCKKNEACSTFIYSPTRCIPVANQLPVLLKLSFDKYNQENEEENMKKNLENVNNVVTRKRRSSEERIYIEAAGATRIQSKTFSYSYVRFLPTDEKENFALLTGEKLCPRLKDTSMRCLTEEDCKILVSFGIVCPYSFDVTTDTRKEVKNDNGAPAPWTYSTPVVLSVVIVLIAVAFVFYRRHKKAMVPENIMVSSHSNHVNYSPVSSESPVKRPLNNNQTMREIEALKQKTDITVFDNAIFSPNHQPSVNIFDVPNPTYRARSATNNAYIEDDKSGVPEDKSHIYASIGKSGKNPLYEESNAKKGVYDSAALSVDTDKEKDATDEKIERVNPSNEYTSVKEINVGKCDTVELSNEYTVVKEENGSKMDTVDLNNEYTNIKEIDDEKKQTQNSVRYERPILRGPSVNQFRPDQEEEDKTFKKNNLNEETNC